MIQRILLPVDFSPRDAAAAHYVKELSRKLAVKVILLHVVPPPDYEAAVLEAGGAALQQLIDTRKRIAQEKIDKAGETELAGLDVERVLVSGFPSDEILEYAEKEKVDLIVMPTHGYGPFRRFLLGSVVSKVLHDAHIPVLTSAHMADPKLDPIEFDTVAAAIDLSENSGLVLKYAASLAQELGAKLKVMHALAEVSGHMGFSLGEPERPHFEAAARERINALGADLSLPFEVHIELGDPGKVICQMARSTSTDLVVIGRSSASGLGRLRAHAYSIIRESNVPVISV
ncbi:MAG: universal stress protein [Bryobacter sp.]|nr:universal stress protein [Bryobacter sp.]